MKNKMAEEYNIKQTENIGFPLTRERVENAKVVYRSGLSASDPENPNRPRDREGFLEKFLNPMIEAGKIGDGVHSKFDDRKFRFDSVTLSETELGLKLGITYYQECAACRKWSPERRTEIIKKGKELFNEPYAFFTRGCGIEVTPITAEGSIFVGKRKVANEDSGYAGELAAVNGWVDYKERLEDVDFREDAFREMKQEYGIQRSEVSKLIFCGLSPASTQADMDFVYIALTTLPDNFFADGHYKRRREDKEHGELMQIANYKNMKRLLETNELSGYDGRFNILYSLRASLEQIKPDEMA